MDSPGKISGVRRAQGANLSNPALLVDTNAPEAKGDPTTYKGVEKFAKELIKLVQKKKPISEEVFNRYVRLSHNPKLCDVLNNTLRSSSKNPERSARVYEDVMEKIAEIEACQTGKERDALRGACSPTSLGFVSNVTVHVARVEPRLLVTETERDQTSFSLGFRSETPDVGSPEKKVVYLQRQIAKRILEDILRGRLQYRPKGSDELAPWPDDFSLESALLHGGRILIKLPPSDSQDFFPTLFRLQQSLDCEALEERTASTHDVKVKEDGTVKEKKGFKYGVKSAFVSAMKVFGMTGELRQYGMNYSPEMWTLDSHGERIHPDGEHGHWYIGYQKPSRERPGAILIGIETSGEGKVSEFGDKHTILATSSKFGVTGLPKHTELEDSPQGTGSMFVDIDSEAAAGLIARWKDENEKPLGHTEGFPAAIAGEEVEENVADKEVEESVDESDIELDYDVAPDNPSVIMGEE